MRRFYLLLLSTADTLFWASAALTQPPGLPLGIPPGGPPTMPMLMLLGEKSVQTDLQLTAAQTKKVSAAMNKQQMAMQSTFNLQPNQRMQKVEEIMKSGDQSADDILTTEQKKRIKQISLQLQGSQAFMSADVAKVLNLTDEQQAKIKEIQNKISKQMDELFRGKKLAPQAFEKKMMEFNKTAYDQAKQLLTSEQTSTWNEMTGAVFRGQVRMMPPMGFSPLPGFGPPPEFPPKR